MKKSLILFTILVSFMAITSIAIAEDVMLQVKPTAITVGIDKNGNEFKRIVFEEQKELNGVKYKTSSIIMVFQDAIAQLDQIKIGQNTKLIVSKSDYKGRDSYSLIAVVTE